MGTSLSSVKKTVDEKEEDVAFVSYLLLGSTAEKLKGMWLLSTGSNRHCVKDLDLLQECKTIKPTKLRFVLGGEIMVTQIGRVSIPLESPDGTITQLKVSNVHYTPDLSVNLLSVGLLMEEGYVVDFEHDYLKHGNQIVSKIVDRENVCCLPVSTGDDQTEDIKDGESRQTNTKVEEKEDEHIICNEEAQNEDNGDGKDHNNEKQIGVPPAIYEGAALEAELMKDISCFNSYPCSCFETFTPSALSPFEAFEDGVIMKMRAGQDGVVLDVKKVSNGGEADYWVKVKIVTFHNPFSAYPFVDGLTGWVPAGFLKIGTLRKFGDIRFELR